MKAIPTTIVTKPEYRCRVVLSRTQGDTVTE